jgi:hypothetical protein
MVAADTHPAGVGPKVVDPIRDCLAQLLVGEVMHQYLDGLPAWLPLGAAIGVLADQLLLLGVHAHDRLPVGQVRGRLLVEVAELRVPVGMLGALHGLAGALQRVALLLEQPSDGVVADRMTLGGQRTSQLRGRLARPPKRRLGIPTSVGIDQRVQRPKQVRVTLGEPLASTARAPDAPGGQPTAGSWIVQLGQGSVHGLPRGAGCPRDRGDPPAAKPPRPGGQQQPPLPLVQVRPDQLVCRRQDHLRVGLHALNLLHPPTVQLVQRGVLSLRFNPLACSER